MNVTNLSMMPVTAGPTAARDAARDAQAAAVNATPLNAASSELRETFDTFVGETFYGQMMSSMRSSVGKPAYFHGGRAEEIFQGQLDQIMATEMTKASAQSFTGPMFELFSLSRS